MLDFLLYLSLVIFLLGLFYKISNWFLKKIGFDDQSITPSQRFLAAVSGLGRVVFSAKILVVLRVEFSRKI